MADKVYDTTKLDFYDIKENLKSYLKKTDDFKDYNFEASGLSTLLDVLAQNTHINAMTSSFILNESYLDTAQLRNSVVSRAAALGYSIRSKTAAYAFVNISTRKTDAVRANVLTIPPFTKFASTIDNKTVNFYNLKPYVAYDDGTGFYEFIDENGSNNIQLFQGTLKTQTYIVGDNNKSAVYVINDQNIDTTTVSVNVFDTTTSAMSREYLNVFDATEITDESRLYQLIESPSGDYQLSFSDGTILGKELQFGNKIEVTYLSSIGEDANGANIFRTDSIIAESKVYPLTVSTVSEAIGGSERESIQSIKLNAPLNFTTQQRMVTSQDYRNIILKNYNMIEDVSSWGGQDNVPPQAGSVFVSMKFKPGISEESKVDVKKNIIERLTNRLAVASIDTVFVDPETVYIELDVNFNFNASTTRMSVSAVENQILQAIIKYFDDNLDTYGKTFRASNILSLVDGISESVLDSRAIVRMQRRFVPFLNRPSQYTIQFPVAIAAPDDVNYSVSSTSFVYENELCFIKNQLKTMNLQVVNAAGDVIIDSVGNYSDNKISLIAFTASEFTGDQIKISATPANPSTIKPLRNFILDIDTSRTYINSTVEF